MSNFVSRDDHSEWDDGWSRVPHGLWTLDIPTGAKVLLGWLHSHTDAYLANVTMNVARRAMGTSSIVGWFDALEAAGFVALTRRDNGHPATVQLKMAPWRSLIGNRAGFGAPTAPKPARKEEQGEDQEPSSLRSEGAIQSKGSTETPVKPPKASALGVAVAQAYVERHRADHDGRDPVSRFQAIRAVATALVKAKYGSDEIVDGMIRSRVMSAKAVQEEIERQRAAAEGRLGPPVPQVVVRAFSAAAPWLARFAIEPGTTLYPQVMAICSAFVSKHGFGIGETLLRLAVALRSSQSPISADSIQAAMFRASVDRFPGELADYPDAMERAFRNNFWRAS